MKSETQLKEVERIKSLRVVLNGVIYSYISDAEMRIADANKLFVYRSI